MLLLTREQLPLNFIQVYHPCILGGPQQRGTKSEVKTYAMDHHDAPRGPYYLKVWVSSTAKRPNCTAKLQCAHTALKAPLLFLTFICSSLQEQSSAFWCMQHLWLVSQYTKKIGNRPMSGLAVCNTNTIRPSWCTAGALRGPCVGTECALRAVPTQSRQ